jgi:flagellar hook assembly protein FlgD
MVTWDGLSDAGKNVPDGQYQIQVVDPGKTPQKLMVVVDNNRSPFTDAIGTNYTVSKNLTCDMPLHDQWNWLPDDSAIAFQY